MAFATCHVNCNPQEHSVLFSSSAAAPAQFYYPSRPGKWPISFPSPPGYTPMQSGTLGQFYNGPMESLNFYVGSQTPPPLMMPLVPPMMYMQHPGLGNGPFMQPFYAPEQGGPGSGMFYQDQYIPPQSSMGAGMTHPLSTHSQESTHSSVRPLSTSAPLPTEFPTVCGASQLPNISHLKVAHLKYHTTMDHDDVLANLSRITISSRSGGDTTLHEKDIADTGMFTNVHHPVVGKSFVPFNYKTRLCSSYANEQPCEMGQRCRFAHGMEELRQVDTPVRPPNMRYKTKLCKNYTSLLHEGQQPYCPYGLRCEFIHPTDKEYAILPFEIRSLVPAAVLFATGSADVTPEDVYRCQPSSISGSVVKVNSNRMHAKHRNIAGSLMCLASSGSSRASESRLYESNNYQAHSRYHHSKYNSGVPNKFNRRRSISIQNINRWRSTDKMVDEEN